jgi:hypothetical protein
MPMCASVRRAALCNRPGAELVLMRGC